MGLLELVPEFQKEVHEVRRAFAIPPNGYITDHEKNSLRHDYDADDEARVNRDADRKLKQLAATDFERKVFKIGEKFGLPLNLYNDSICGISWYILRNRIIVPAENWVIETEPIDPGRPIKMRWATIRAYAPLDKQEATSAIQALNKKLREYQPEPLSGKKRIKGSPEARWNEVSLLLEEAAEKGSDYLPQTDRQRQLLERADTLARDIFGYGIKAER